VRELLDGGVPGGLPGPRAEDDEGLADGALLPEDLRDRIKSYFANDLIDSRGPRIVDMVTKSKSCLAPKGRSPPSNWRNGWA